MFLTLHTYCRHNRAVKVSEKTRNIIYALILCHQVPPGGDVDPCYYVQNDSSRQDMEKILRKSVSRGTHFSLDYPVKKGQLLK